MHGNTQNVQAIANVIAWLEYDTRDYAQASALRLERLEDALGIKYRPDQPRVPAGSPEGGQWTDEGGGGGSSSTSKPSANARASAGTSQPRAYSASTPEPSHPYSTSSGVSYGRKIHRQMSGRGWTPEHIDEAVKKGPRIDAINKATGGPATRYVNPRTNQSVVIDNTTNRILQVGGPDFEFGKRSGDVPGAQMRPASSATPQTGGGGSQNLLRNIFRRKPGSDDLLR